MNKESFKKLIKEQLTEKKGRLNETISPADIEPVIKALKAIQNKAQAPTMAAAMAAPVEKEKVKLDMDAAEKAHMEGVKLWKEKKYEQAAKLFADAYEKGKRPTSMYNSARCYEMAGRKEMAVMLFKKYLTIAKNPEGRALAQNKIKSLEA